MAGLGAIGEKLTAYLQKSPELLQKLGMMVKDTGHAVGRGASKAGKYAKELDMPVVGNALEGIGMDAHESPKLAGGLVAGAGAALAGGAGYDAYQAHKKKKQEQEHPLMSLLQKYGVDL